MNYNQHLLFHFLQLALDAELLLLPYEFAT
jgi:hypothetical protein